MQSASDGQSLRPSKHAITDIFDEQKRVVLVKYSTRLIFGLTAFGILAFVITGLVGYPPTGQSGIPGWLRFFDGVVFLRKPAFLFAFFCALIFVLQASVLREDALRRYRRPVYMATTVSIVLVSALYLFRDNLGSLLSKIVNAIGQLLGKGNLIAHLRELVTNPWFWLSVYVLVLLVLFGQAALTWRRAAAGKLANQPIDLGTGRPSSLPDEEQADVWDLVAGDLTLRSLLLVPIGLLFWYPLPRLLAHSLGVPIGPDPSVKGSFNLCSVSLPGTCGPNFAFELWWLDLIIAAIILALGVIAVALLVQREAIRLLNVAQINRGQEILNAFLDILLSPFNRRPRSRVGRRVSRGTQASLRPLVWPVLIFLGVVGTAGMADFIQAAEQCPRFYDNATQATLPARCQAPGGLPDTIVGHALGHVWASGLPVLGFAILAVGGTVLAFAVLFGRWRVAGNIFSFLTWMALSNALTVGLLLLALTLLNWAALFLAFLIRLSVTQSPSSSYGVGDWLGLTNPYRQHPFYPGLFALALYAALLIAGVAVSVSSRSK
jgi:hypothetical protein